MSESLQLLAKIPVLPCLHPATDQEPVGATSSDKENYSLFDWISSQVDNENNLHSCGVLLLTSLANYETLILLLSQLLWVKVLRIIPEFRILRLTFHRKSASIS